MLDESSDNESNASIQKLTINEHYAEAYAYKKERQEYLQCMCILLVVSCV